MNMRDPKISGEVDELRGDFNKLRDDVRKLAESVIGEGRQHARHAQDQMRSGWEHGVHTFQKQVEDRPMATMAGAFLVGMIIGRLLGK